MKLENYFSKRNAGIVLSVSLIFLAAQFSGFLSFADNFSGVQFATCSVTNDDGDIGNCEMWNEHFREDLNGDFTAENAEFWVEIVDADQGDEHSPQAYWLYRNGYVSEDINPEHAGELENLHVGDGDFVWDNEIRESLENASTAYLTVDVSTPGQTTLEFTEGAQTYNDEPDCFGDYCGDVVNDEYYFSATSERHAKNIMQEPVTVSSDRIRFEDDRMYAKFDMADILTEGGELPGEFVSWSGRYPTLDEVGASGSIEVDFEADSDGDGVLEVNDNCPNQGVGSYGLTENGCPIEREDLPDSDGDGVKDRFDSAPDTYGSSKDGSPTKLEDFVRIIPGFEDWKQENSIFEGVRIG